MEKILVKSSSHYQFYQHDGADTVTVVFAARNDRPPKFTFWKSAQSLNSHIIYLNSNVPEWYRAGIPGISGGIRGAIKEILGFKESLKAKRLVMTGSSMGAYGALLYGSLAKADELLVFGVEPILGVPGGKTDITRNHLQYMYSDLTSLILPPTTVFYGAMDINDILGAWLLRKRRNADVVCIPDAQHDTPDFLARSNLLSNLFEDLVAGVEIRKFGYCEGDAGNDQIVEFLWRVNYLVVEKKWAQILKMIEGVPNITGSSLIVSYLNGIAHFRGNNFKSAIEILESLLQKEPGYWEAWMNVGASHLKLGNLSEAIRACQCAMKLRPHRSIIHLQMSNVYSQSGDNELAYKHAEWACKLNYSRPEYFEALGKLALLVNRKMPEIDRLKIDYDANVKAAQKLFGDRQFLDDLRMKQAC